jgi:hypothetical protein
MKAKRKKRSIHTPKYYEYDLPIALSQKRALKMKGVKGHYLRHLNRKQAMDLLGKQNPKSLSKLSRSLRNIDRKSYRGIKGE